MLVSKRKLNAILRSKATVDKQVKEGDLVQIYVKHSNAKRGKWSLPKPVLRYDLESQTVTVAGAKGKYRKTAIEDTLFAVPQEMQVAVAIQEAIDECSNSIDDALDDRSEQLDYISDDDGQEIPILEAHGEEESGFDTEPRNSQLSAFYNQPTADTITDRLRLMPASGCSNFAFNLHASTLVPKQGRHQIGLLAVRPRNTRCLCHSSP